MSLKSALDRLQLAAVWFVAATSVGVAEPAALVESVVTQSASANVMSYVEPGQTFRLGPHDSIVLSYTKSCLRETIIGGTVTIGMDHSNVQGGIVTWTKPFDCSANFVLSGKSELAAGRVFRGERQTDSLSHTILLDNREGL